MGGRREIKTHSRNAITAGLAGAELAFVNRVVFGADDGEVEGHFGGLGGSSGVRSGASNLRFPISELSKGELPSFPRQGRVNG